jgi:hypothetical protein
MTITSFNPIILTSKADAATAVFEALGFEWRHMKTDIDDRTEASIRMKDANGFHVDIVQIDVLPQDMTAIRMNVRDFDEAFELLTARGFHIVQGGKVTDTESSRAVMLVSPSGFAINLVKHIRKEEDAAPN